MIWSDESLFFYVIWTDRQCASLPWLRDGTKVHYWKNASQRRQCDALGNVVLAILESWQLHECNFDM